MDEYPFLFPRKPTSEERIQSWEMLNSIKLPDQYRNFLLQFNGAGTSQEWAFEYIDPETKKPTTDGLFTFLALEDIKSTMEWLVGAEPWNGEGYHLHELLPIAHNFCHSCMTMIGYRGEECGKIILLDYLGYEDENGHMKKVYLSDSFDEFLQIFFKD